MHPNYMYMNQQAWHPQQHHHQSGDRFPFLAPFLLGGLGGLAVAPLFRPPIYGPVPVPYGPMPMPYYRPY